MRRYGILSLIVIALGGGVLWPVTGQSAGAASFALSDRDREDAIVAGKRSVVSEDFGGEWRARNPSGETVTVMTPFHRLALAARNAAFKNETLKPKEVDTVLKESTNKLTVWVTLRGGTPDFARFYAPALLGGKSEIKASFVQNERTALRAEDGGYAARCVYVFPAEGLTPKGRYTLVVRNSDEKDVSTFTLDLSAMR
jgi:hypothetical protein